MKTWTGNGLCLCGCGRAPSQYIYDDPEGRWKAGEFRRYVNGHHYINARRTGEITGYQYDRMNLREKRRGDLVRAVLGTDGKKALEGIFRKVAPEFKLQACVRLINSARDWSWWDGKVRFDDIPAVIVKAARKAVAPYERSFIDNERETEIPMLLKRANIISLDATIGEGDTTGYEIRSSEQLNPLEILMLNEQREENEDRERRIKEWSKWQERRRSSFPELSKAVFSL